MRDVFLKPFQTPKESQITQTSPSGEKEYFSCFSLYPAGDLYPSSCALELSCDSWAPFLSFSAQLDTPSTHDLSSITIGRGKTDP